MQGTSSSRPVKPLKNDINHCKSNVSHAQADEYLERTGEVLGPLHGIPFTVKAGVRRFPRFCNLLLLLWFPLVAAWIRTT